MNIQFNETKFNGLIKFASVLTKIFFRISLTVAIITIVFSLLVVFIPVQAINYEITFETFKFELGNVLQYEIKYQFENMKNMQLFALYEVLNAFISSAFLTLIFYPLHKILVDVKEGKPFSKKNVKNIYNIAFIIIFGGVIIPLFQFLVGILSINKIGIAGLDINFGINFTMILIGLLILIIASIFQYGAHLQNENDQTI